MITKILPNYNTQFYRYLVGVSLMVLSPGPWSPGLLQAHEMYGLYALLTEPECQTRGDSEIQRRTLATPTQKPTKNGTSFV